MQIKSPPTRLLLSRTTLLTFALFAASSAVTACSREVYSPPSQLFAMPAARALRQGETTASATAAHQGTLFDPSLNITELGLRHGLTDEFDIEGSAGYAVVSGGEAPNLDPRLITGRVGVIANPKRGPFTFRGGVGGGHNPSVGNFAAVDVGVAAAYHNCVLTPLVGVSGFVSNPLDPHAVNVASASDHTVDMKTPYTTVGWTVSSSLGVQLDRASCRQGKAGTTLSLGFNASEITNGNASDAWAGMGLRLEGSL